MSEHGPSKSLGTIAGNKGEAWLHGIPVAKGALWGETCFEFDDHLQLEQQLQSKCSPYIHFNTIKPIS